jgi:hypothetical protein
MKHLYFGSYLSRMLTINYFLGARRFDAASALLPNKAWPSKREARGCAATPRLTKTDSHELPTLLLWSSQKSHLDWKPTVQMHDSLSHVHLTDMSMRLAVVTQLKYFTLATKSCPAELLSTYYTDLQALLS